MVERSACNRNVAGTKLGQPLSTFSWPQMSVQKCAESTAAVGFLQNGFWIRLGRVNISPWLGDNV